MLDAAKIRTTKNALRHVGMPVLVLGFSMLIGAGINHLARPAISQWNQQARAGHRSQASSELAGRLMAAELMAVEPVTQAQPAQQNITRRASFAKAGTADKQSITTAAAPTTYKPAALPHASGTTTVATSLEASVTEAVMNPMNPMNHADHADHEILTPNTAAPAVATHNAIPAGHRVFNGRLIRPARTLTMVTTAYSPDERSCGPNADGTTASGKSVWTNGMKMVAADTRLLPFGTLVSVPGYYDGQPVPVLDRGGAIKGRRLDMLYPTHEIAITWGRKTQKVTIWEYAD